MSVSASTTMKLTMLSSRVRWLVAVMSLQCLVRMLPKKSSLMGL